MRRGKNAELVLKDTLTLYGEDWVELESQMGRVRVKAPCKHPEGLVEGQVMGVRVLARLARRRGGQTS